MEKKTVGQFIAALRKANGMTQKELGERLFVSDKTVSRWERDECYPELSLIPLIAELFGVTSDEILRGERDSKQTDDDGRVYERQRQKSDRQFRAALDRTARKYKNLTLISFGITIFGLLAAVIADLGFSKGLIAFCAAMAFCVASEICQICFAISSRVTFEDDYDGDACRVGKINEINTKITKAVIGVTAANISLFSFCLPTVTLINGANYGLLFGSWAIYGTAFAMLTLALCYIVYMFFIKKYLVERGYMTLSGERRVEFTQNVSLLKRITAVSVAVAVAIGAAIFALNAVGPDAFVKGLEFDSYDELKSFMESDYDKWYEEGYSYYDKTGNKVFLVPIDQRIENIFQDAEEQGEYYFPNKVYEKITEENGTVICEFYYNPDLYYDIIYQDAQGDTVSVTVITKQARSDGYQAFNNVKSFLYILLAADFVICAAVYAVKAYKQKKRK